MARIAMTGATGFAGSRLVERLSADGHEIGCLARPRRDRQLQDTPHVQWISGDAGSPGALDTLVRDADTVIHVAGLTRALGPDGFHATNTRATAMLVAAARRAGAGHFILVSSLAAMRPDISPYAWSKALAEAGAIAMAGDMPLTIVRPPAILGPGDSATRDVMRWLRRGWLVCPGGADASTFSWIDVDDLARFVSGLAVEAPRERLTRLSPCSGQDTSWRDVAAAAEQVLGRRVRCVGLPAAFVSTIGAAAGAAAWVTRKPLILSPGKARELLQPGWQADSVMIAPTPLHQTLSRCFLELP